MQRALQLIEGARPHDGGGDDGIADEPGQGHHRGGLTDLPAEGLPRLELLTISFDPFRELREGAPSASATRAWLTATRIFSASATAPSSGVWLASSVNSSPP